MQVGARKAALVAGGLVAVCVAVLFCVRVVPTRVISLLGGPSKAVERWGGVRVVYQPPPASDAAIEEYLRVQAHVERRGEALLLEFPDVAIDDVSVASLTDVLVAGGLSMKLALETDWAARIAANNELVITERQYEESEDTLANDARDRDALRRADPRARLEQDYWIAEDDGSRHTTPYLIAPTRRALEDAIELARARGFTLEPGTEIRFEDVEIEMGEQAGSKQVRAYLLASEVLINGTMIADANGSFEPNTGRAIVLLDLDARGGELFCELTRRITGQKLALLLGGTIRSAPIINSAICGGRASITMGGTDPDRQLRERDMIVEVLRHGALPAGGTIRDLERLRPADTGVQTLLGRLLLGLLCGLVAAAITFLVVRFARPTWARATHAFAGAFPWKRLAITALAPLVWFVGKRLTIPGIEDPDLEYLFTGSENTSVIALGFAPVMLGYFLVELTALAIKPLRWRRHDPAGRIALGRAAALLAILFALAYGYFIARSFESSSVIDNIFSLTESPGWRFRLILMISVTAGTLLLAILAGVISEHGLGNGYGVLAATAIVIDALPGLSRGADLAQLGLGLVTFAAIVTATCLVMRWRVTDGREPALRVPTSGMAPLAGIGAFIALVFAVTGLAGNQRLFDLLIWSDVFNGWKVRLALIAITIPIWSWIFARPAVIERVALQGGLDRPTSSTWLRATIVSAWLLLGPAVFAAAITVDERVVGLVNPVSALLVGAVLLDVIADARARRAKLAVAGVIHQVQYLGVVEHALAEAKIPFHAHAGHLRTLIAFFAPWAPVHVLVLEEHAIEARLQIDGALRAAPGRVPEARAI